MHDPALKSYFADRDIIEIPIRDHVPQWAGEIDFTTLREEPTGQVAALRQKVAELGNPRLDAVLAEKVRTMLKLRGYTSVLKLEGAKTMEETVDRFQQGLKELVRRGAREGRREGQRTVLRRQIARRFGEDTAGRVSEVIESLPGPDAIDRVTDALFECGTGEEFVERLRTA